MRSACWIAAASAAVSLLAGSPAIAAGRRDAITTPGSGTLTMCRDWLVYDACSTYHNVALPRHIAVGDKIALTYGSNPKEYDFHVVRIRQQDDSCTVLSNRSGANGKGEKIKVAPCRAAAQPAAAR
ncbi:MAG TPA: hypothetical protein VND95_03200 [Stellaceae bacterium]|nr:hypothetical protein [Stellaceae bacterium]